MGTLSATSGLTLLLLSLEKTPARLWLVPVGLLLSFVNRVGSNGLRVGTVGIEVLFGRTVVVVVVVVVVERTVFSTFVTFARVVVVLLVVGAGVVVLIVLGIVLLVDTAGFMVVGATVLLGLILAVGTGGLNLEAKLAGMKPSSWISS